MTHVIVFWFTSSCTTLNSCQAEISRLPLLTGSHKYFFILLYLLLPFKLSLSFLAVEVNRKCLCAHFQAFPAPAFPTNTALCLLILRCRWKIGLGKLTTAPLKPRLSRQAECWSRPCLPDQSPFPVAAPSLCTPPCRDQLSPRCGGQAVGRGHVRAQATGLLVIITWWYVPTWRKRRD